MRQITLLLALVSTLPAADVFDPVCPTKGPVLRRVLETEELVKQSSHCVSPTMSRSPLGHLRSVQGVVSLSILVDHEGKVTCVKVIKGHPLLVGRALEAAKAWTFRPMMRRGRGVSFFGHLDFPFSLDRETTPAPCVSGH